MECSANSAVCKLHVQERTPSAVPSDISSPFLFPAVIVLMLGTVQLTYFAPCCTPYTVLSTFCSHAVLSVLHTAGDITDERRFCYEVKHKVLVLVLILLEYYSCDLLCCWSHGSSVGIVTRLRVGSWGFKSRQCSDRPETYSAYPASH